MALEGVKRVLVYRLGSLGDHLVALPCYRLVARAFPDAERRLLTTAPVSEKALAAEAVLRGTGLIDRFMTHASGERNVWALLRLVGEIRRWKPDVLVYLAGARGESIARRDGIFFRLCGIRRQIGVPLTAEMQANRVVEAPVWARVGTPWVEEEGRRLARCVGELAELGDARLEDAASWSPGLLEAEHAAARRLLEGMGDAPFWGFSLGAKVQANRWELERWRELLTKIAVEWPGFGLAIVGSGDEHETSEAIAEDWRGVRGAGPVLNLCGVSELRVSAAVLERAAMFLGHDSGPAHLAAAVGTPVLGVFGARMQAGAWVPHGKHVRVVLHWVDCGGCVLDTCIVEKKKCIFSIGVDEVMTAMREHVATMGIAVGQADTAGMRVL
jgi:heptosyltransferase-3